MILLRGAETWPDMSGLLLVLLLVVLALAGIFMLCWLGVCVVALARILYVLITQGPAGVKRMSEQAKRPHTK